MANGWHRRRNTAAVARRKAEYSSTEHRAARARYTADIAAGRGICWRCTRPIPPGTPSRAWHVGHDDARVIRGPEHAACNLKAAARKGARMRNTRATKTRVVIVRRRNLLG